MAAVLLALSLSACSPSVMTGQREPAAANVCLSPRARETALIQTHRKETQVYEGQAALERLEQNIQVAATQAHGADGAAIVLLDAPSIVALSRSAGILRATYGNVGKDNDVGGRVLVALSGLPGGATALLGGSAGTGTLRTGARWRMNAAQRGQSLAEINAAKLRLAELRQDLSTLRQLVSCG